MAEAEKKEPVLRGAELCAKIGHDWTKEYMGGMQTGDKKCRRCPAVNR